MPEKYRKIVAGALAALGGVALAMGVDLDAADTDGVLSAVDGAYAAGAALLAAVAALVLKFKAKK